MIDLETLFKLSYGMCIVSAQKDAKISGCIVNTVFQVTPEPPRTAATYHQEKNKGIVAMKKYKCTLCGYIYDPAIGDPANGIEPGTSFDDLPDDWTCPECGASKDEFEPL